MSDLHFPLRMAAAVEAAAAGHPEIDVDHLLLGLSVIGGPSAWELGRAGADLSALRRAAAHVRNPGVDSTVTRSALRAGDRRGSLRTPVTGRAGGLLSSAPDGRDDRGVLLLLLDEDEPIRRLLGHLDVDADALRGRVADPTAEPDPPAVDDVTWPGVALPPSASAGRSWVQADWHGSFPVPLDSVRALVLDPTRCAEWDHRYVDATVTADGVQQLTRADGRIETRTVLDVVDGQGVAWSRHDPRGGRAQLRHAGDVLQVALVPAEGGTTVGLRRHLSGRGVVWRLARPVVTRAARGELRFLAQAIHQAAAS